MYCQLIRNEIKQIKFVLQKIFLHDFSLIIFIFITLSPLSFFLMQFISVKFVLLYTGFTYAWLTIIKGS